MLTQTACLSRRYGQAIWRGDGLRKGTKRRVYKALDLESMLKLAASQAALISQKELQELRDMELGHMNALRSGAGTMRDLVEVESMADISIEMASREIGPEALVSAKLLKMEIGAAKVMLEQGGALCVIWRGPAGDARHARVPRPSAAIHPAQDLRGLHFQGDES